MISLAAVGPVEWLAICSSPVRDIPNAWTEHATYGVKTDNRADMTVTNS